MLLSSFCACKNGLFAKKKDTRPDPYVQAEWEENSSREHAGPAGFVDQRNQQGRNQTYSPVGYEANIRGSQYPHATMGTTLNNQYPERQGNPGWDNRIAMHPQDERRNVDVFTVPEESEVEERTSIGFPKLFKPSREKGDDPFERYPGYSRNDKNESVFRLVSYSRQFEDELPDPGEGFAPLPVVGTNNRTDPKLPQPPAATRRAAPAPIREYLPVKHSPGLADELETHKLSPGYDSTVTRPYNDSWRPDGIIGYWPQDEYIADGGVNRGKPFVRSDWNIEGLYPEDTVGHYDTVDGRIVLEPSNRVHLYSPRFGSVRKIDSPNSSGSRVQLTAARNVQEPYTGNASLGARNAVLEQGSRYARGGVHANDIDTNIKPGGMNNNTGTIEAKSEVQPFAFANALMKAGFDGSDMPYLIEAGNNAIQWSGSEETRVRFNGETAYKLVNNEKTISVFGLDDKTKNDQFRIIKVASKDKAQPGETVGFTIRFENIGTRPIGNITIIDSLSGRLELIPDSVEASLETGFSVQKNEAGSLVLRWEISDPLPAPSREKPKQFGVIRFQCRVR